MIELAPRPSLQDWPPHGLVSLFDVLEIKGKSFHSAVSALAGLRMMIAMHRDKHSHEEFNIAVTGEINDSVRRDIITLEQACLAMGALVTAMTIGELDQKLSDGECSYNQLEQGITSIQDNLRRELTLCKLFALDRQQSKLFENPTASLPEAAQDRFRSAMPEIEEASRCLALRRDTACVFHLMRAMEVCVRAVARCLEISDPIKPSERNWGKILQRINDAMKDKKNWKDGDKPYFEAVIVGLDRVKNVWRNPTMHVEERYTDEEAKDVFEAVRAFLKKLALRMGEDGLPLA